MVVDAALHPDASTMDVLYRSGGGPMAPVAVGTAGNGTRSVRLALGPREVMILR